MAYLERVCLLCFPSGVMTDVIDSFGVRIALNKHGHVEKAGEAALVEVPYDVKPVPSLVRRLLPRKNDLPTGRIACLLDVEHTRISAPIMLGTLVFRLFHAKDSCHVGVSRTSRRLESLYW